MDYDDILSRFSATFLLVKWSSCSHVATPVYITKGEAVGGVFLLKFCVLLATTTSSQAQKSHHQEDDIIKVAVVGLNFSSRRSKITDAFQAGPSTYHC